MLVGSLNDLSSISSLLSHNAWKEAFAWLKTIESRLPNDGEYEIIGRDVRAIVQTVELKSRTDRFFEAHRREIDLQVCFEGEELIEWAPLHTLTAQTTYNEEKDYTLYDLQASATTISMKPRLFAIFFPEDGHMPGIINEHATTRKVVIKIAKSLLEGKWLVLGPYEVELDYDQPHQKTFENLLNNGRFDRINREDITLQNFPFAKSGRGKVKKKISLINLGHGVKNCDLKLELASHDVRAVTSEWVLALNAAKPELMDNHIIITPETLWTGREGAPEVICLHKDAGKRRLRTHYADTGWGPHIWYAVEPLDS